MGEEAVNWLLPLTILFWILVVIVAISVTLFLVMGVIYFWQAMKVHRENKTIKATVYPWRTRNGR